MRRSADLPRRRSRLRASGRVAIIATALFIVVVVIFGRAVARFYIDALWFDGLGQSGVFWSVIRAKLTLFAVFFVAFAVLAGVNMAIADKLAPSRFPINVHPVVDRLHDAFGRRLRLYRYLLAGFFSLLMALPAAAQWRAWLLFRNAQSFDTADDQFGVDVGFYVFELPFLNFVLDWLFFALILVLFLTVITHVLNGGVMFASPIPTLNSGTRGHVAVLLAVLAALKAADYWVRRYETTNERRGFVQGATYSVVHAQLPALLLLAFVALVTAVLYVSTLKTESWRLPLISSAVWMVLAVLGGYIYPAAIQGLVVNPNQKSREADYIERNVHATRAAMGIDPTVDVVEVDLEIDTLTVEEIADDEAPLEDIRVLNPVEMRGRFEIDEANEPGFTVDDLDVDRYVLEDGAEPEQVLIAARELDLENVANRSWQGRHLINTHGCGIVMAPAGRVEEGGRPDYQDVDLVRPELYFSPSLSGYAVAGTEESERACTDENPSYEGTAGVEMSSFVRRFAFGLAFMDYNVVASGAIDPDSQMLWVRNIRDRVEKLAPFLSYDGDPYPVVVDGEVLWVIDGYTSTSRYPYAQAVGDDVALSPETGIPRDANYVRNSVKAVVNAYTGAVTFYVVDEEDPIIQAWMSAFPDLFSDGADMADDLRDHLRYPEDLFRIQSNIYSKYQLAPEDFFDRTGAWSVAQNPGSAPREAATAGSADESSAGQGQEPELATETSSVRFTPYYTMFGQGENRQFVLLRPFVPFSSDDGRQELRAFMTASSDPATYGQLTVYDVVSDPPPDGPLTVANSIESDGEISRLITPLTQSGSRVRFGDLQLVRVADGLLWVRPLYVSREQDGGSDSTNEYRYIIASYNNRSAYATTLVEALAQLFPGLTGTVGERSDTEVPASLEVSDLPEVNEPDAGTGDEPSTEPDDETGEPSSVEELLAEADDLLREAEAQLLVDGDLGAYQERVDEAARKVDEALQLVGGVAPTSEPETTDPDTTGPPS